MKSLLLFAALSLGVACRDVGVVSPQPDAVQPPATSDDEKLAPLVARLGEIAEHKREQLELQVVPNLESEPRMYASDACIRPDEQQQALLRRQIDAWIATAVPGTQQLPESEPTYDFGCIEPGGIVAAVQVDRIAPGSEEGKGYWWVVRVRGAAGEGAASKHPIEVRVIASQVGWSHSLFMHSVEETQLSVIALVDLDHDGVRDPVMVRAVEVGMQMINEYDLVIIKDGKPVTVGHHTGRVDIAPWQPSPDKGTFVVELTNYEEPQGDAQYRCVTAASEWTECWSAIAARKFMDAREATSSLTGLAYDRDSLEDALVALDVDPAERAALVAQALPSKPVDIVARFVRQRALKRSRLTAAERLAVDRRMANVIGDAMRDAFDGNAACQDVSDKAQRTIVADLGRFLAKHEGAVIAGLEACKDGGCRLTSKTLEPKVFASCTGPTGSHWLVAWEEHAVGPDGPFVLGGSELLHVSGKRITSLITVRDQLVGPRGALTPSFDAKMHVHEKSVVSLVESDPMQDFAPRLTAVVDTKSMPSEIEGSLRWRLADDLLTTTDGLAQVNSMLDDRAITAYARATPEGVQIIGYYELPLGRVDRPVFVGRVPHVVADTLVSDARLRIALLMLGDCDDEEDDASDEDHWDRCVAALEALADPETVAKLKAALARR